MAVVCDTSDFDWLPEMFERRRDLVQDLMDQGRAFTDAWIAAGGRHRDPKTRRFHATGRRIARVKHATGNQYARGVEHVAYHKFIDWWDRSW